MSTRIDPLVVGIVDAPGGPRWSALELCCHRIGGDGALERLDAAPASLTAPTDDTHWRPEDDLGLFKPRTDVVVAGSVWPERGRRVQRMVARVGVPEVSVEKAILVVGNRRALVRGGAVAFTIPEAFERIPLSWRLAYGGVDGSAYPRNPVGRGWRVRDAANVEPRHAEIELPNFEDPAHVLAPETLLARHPTSWCWQPIPQTFGWVDPSWFPRCVHLGAVPEMDEPSALDELRYGVLARRTIREPASVDARTFEFFSGASAGLAVPWLRGGETLDTTGLDPAGRFLVRLPPPRRARAKVRGRATDVTWRMHTVYADLDARILAVLWRAEVRLPAALAPDRVESASIDAQDLVLEEEDPR